MENELIKYNYGSQFVALSNALIQSKEKTSLLESKVEVLAIYRLKEEMKVTTKSDIDGNDYSVHYVDIKITEIGALADRKIRSGSIYEDVAEIAIALKRKINIIRDKDKKGYQVISLYGDVASRDGILHIEFNPSAEFLFKDLLDNYSKLSLPILFSFKSNGGFQLYKLLKSYAYNLPSIDLSKTQEELPYYCISYSLSELRMSLGYVDLLQPELKKESEKKHPDFDKMDEMEKKPKYRRWSDFDNRVITPGKKEINKQSDIYISKIEPLKSGRGGKINEIAFYIQHNLNYYKNTKEVKVPKSNSGELNEYEVVENNMNQSNGPDVVIQKSDIDEVFEYMKTDIDITKKQCELLLKDANGDINLVIKTFETMKTQNFVRDAMAWMRAAVKEGGYEEPISLSRGDTERGKQLNDLMENYEENKKDENVKELVWKRYKEKPDFNKFLDYVGLPLEMIEELPVENRMELYLEYIKSNK